MSDATRHEGACSRPADRDLIANLEGHLTAQDIGDFVAIVVEMVWRHGARWRGFLEHHHVLTGLATLHLERSRSAGCHVPYRSLTGQHDEALRVHGNFLRAILVSRWKRTARITIGYGGFPDKGI